MKKNSEKMSILFSCSMKGEKLPLFFVGKSKKPHCFKNIALDKQDFYYGSNKAGWMTTKLFRDWLKKLTH